MEIGGRVVGIGFQQLVEFVRRILQIAVLHILHGKAVAREAVVGIRGHHAAQNIQPVIRHACATIPAGWHVLSSSLQSRFPGRSGPIRRRMPLGDPYLGICTACRARCPTDACDLLQYRLRTRRLPQFPGTATRPTPYASGSSAAEPRRRDHPIRDRARSPSLDQGLGNCRGQWPTGQGESLERQARAYLASYLAGRSYLNGEV